MLLNDGGDEAYGTQVLPIWYHDMDPLCHPYVTLEESLHSPLKIGHFVTQEQSLHTFHLLLLDMPYVYSRTSPISSLLATKKNN